MGGSVCDCIHGAMLSVLCMLLSGSQGASVDWRQQGSTNGTEHCRSTRSLVFIFILHFVNVKIILFAIWVDAILFFFFQITFPLFIFVIFNVFVVISSVYFMCHYFFQLDDSHFYFFLCRTK